MKPGDIFLSNVANFSPGSPVGNHLYAVLSNPADAKEGRQLLVVVTISSYETYKEDTCQLTSSDHHKISHPSVVEYRYTQYVPAERILQLQQDKNITFYEPLEQSVLHRILQGALQSRKIPDKYIQFLDRQGLFGD